MPIEKDITRIADALEKIAGMLEQPGPTIKEAEKPKKKTTPKKKPDPVKVPKEEPKPEPASKPEPTPVNTDLPFNDGKSLVAWVMSVYQEIGPEKGAGIQTVLGNLGYSNINDIQPEHYEAFYQGVEGLK